METFNKFIRLYADVFKNYPFAASITTLLFVIAYFLWMKIIKEKHIKSDKIWKHPAFILFIGWLILTPLLGFIVTIISIIKDIITIIFGLYAKIFEKYPEAAGFITIIFLVAYFIWRLIIKKWATNAKGLWSRPGIVLLAAWLVVTPIFGYILKWVEPPSYKASKSPPSVSSRSTKQIDAEKPASGERK